MTFELRKKPVFGQKFDCLDLILDGNHTIKQKIAMMLEVKFVLEHSYNVHYAGPINLSMLLVDCHGHPLTHFPNGEQIGHYHGRLTSPYHCAADTYRAG